VKGAPQLHLNPHQNELTDEPSWTQHGVFHVDLVKILVHFSVDGSSFLHAAGTDENEALHPFRHCKVDERADYLQSILERKKYEQDTVDVWVHGEWTLESTRIEPVEFDGREWFERFTRARGDENRVFGLAKELRNLQSSSSSSPSNEGRHTDRLFGKGRVTAIQLETIFCETSDDFRSPFY